MRVKKLVNLLIKINYKISCAESCTGGMLASKIVSISNASQVFDAGFVTYANNSKIKFCGVSENSIKTHGVVSEKVAAEMAVGAAEAANANVGVGISGIAGPSGGTKEKPVGTVCFGFCVNKSVTTITCHFSGNRNSVRRKAVSFAIKKLYEILI